MTKLEELLREVAAFKATRGGGVKLVTSDRGDVLAEWPKGCPDAPTTREQAVEKALVLMRERGLSV